MYRPVSFDDFPGLDLATDAEDTAGSPYLRDVEFDLRGRVRQRRGAGRFDATAASGGSQCGLFPAKLGAHMLLALTTGGGNLYLDKYTTAGVRTAVGNWSAVFLGSVVHFGTPTASYVYISSTTSGHAATAAIRRYDGTSLTTATGEPLWLAVTPQSNRLVQAGFIANADRPTGISVDVSTSTVVFSDAGAPETYSANNYVHLRPGDGEAIRGIVTWRDLTFVFKETSMFVFYGESTDSSGNAVFNYRRVDLPAAIADPGNVDVRPVSAGTRGVYFAGTDGIYRTTGGVPELISQQIEPLFRGEGGDLASSRAAYPYLSAVRDRLFFRFTDDTTGATSTLVFDERTQKWTVWQLGFDSAGGAYPVAWPGFTYPNDLFWQFGDHIYRMSKDYLTDAGTRIGGVYQSPWFEVGQEREAVIRESLLWGTGTVGVSMAADHGSFGTVENVELGDPPSTVSQGRVRTSRKGFRHAHRVQAPAAVTDDFSSNTIGNYTHDVGSGFSVSGGVVVSANTSDRRAYYNVQDFPSDVQATVKFTTGASVAGAVEVILKRLDGSNWVNAFYNPNSPALVIQKKDAGVTSNLASAGATAVGTTTSGWLRFRVEGNVLTAELWTTLPTTTGVPADSLTYTLTGANATKYGTGIDGYAGFGLSGGAGTSGWTLDDLSMLDIGRWAVHRVTHHVRSQRRQGVKS